MGLYYSRICENIIDKKIELTGGGEKSIYLQYSDISFANLYAGILRIDDYSESYYSCQTPDISQQVLEALIDGGFKRIKSNLIINPNIINFISLGESGRENRMSLCKNGNLNIEIYSEKIRDDANDIYHFSLEVGIPVMLDFTFPITQLREYKNYILEFKERYPEKLLMYELDWKNYEEPALFDYNIFL